MVDQIPPADELATATPRRVGSGRSPRESTPLAVLSKRRRRTVLRLLLDAPDGVASLEGLADRLADHEREAERAPGRDHRQRLLVGLHHVDLPKLAEAGALEYDPRSRTVRYHGDDAWEAVLELTATTGGR